MKNFLYYAGELNAEAYCVRLWYVQVYIFKKITPSNHKVGFIERQMRGWDLRRLLCWRGRKGWLRKQSLCCGVWHRTIEEDDVV